MDATDDSGRARHVAERLCSGFRHHDRREREAAVRAFSEVDCHQFAHLDAGATRRAAEAYVAALWEKDAVEERCVRGDGGLDRTALASADWSGVRTHLERRTAEAGIDREYARLTTEAWRQHKVGGDYWTPTMDAQRLEVRAAIGDPSYPHKASDGRSGFGPLAARYLVGVELHDLHTEGGWRRAVETMVPYYEVVLGRGVSDA